MTHHIHFLCIMKLSLISLKPQTKSKSWFVALCCQNNRRRQDPAGDNVRHEIDNMLTIFRRIHVVSGETGWIALQAGVVRLSGLKNCLMLLRNRDYFLNNLQLWDTYTKCTVLDWGLCCWWTYRSRDRSGPFLV